MSYILFSSTSIAETHPASEDYPKVLQSEIEQALLNKGEDYQPRTKHIKEGKALYTNRLILEDSPYLLQHAHNPVNWYPWGEEAFTTAKQLNKPVFLSIGYATCHWCHVMEEESFESIEIAKYLNEHFIAIKVDREQYPDIDETYMTAVMLMNGQGGWPMSSFLLPDSRPFYGGTYYPPANFRALLENISHAWQNKEAEIIAQGEELSNAVKKATATQAEVETLGLHSIEQAVESILAQFDSNFGGFSRAPKFPNESLLSLLLQTNDKKKNKKQKAALEQTLAAMAQGGIYDQIAGGFHRYSTDEQWLVPHFEKMLYNQAYLSRVYIEAWRQNCNPLHARIAQQTLDYVLREMRRDDGTFYSATDADSEGEEGTFFVWSKDEINQLLEKQDAEFIIRLYGVTKRGNFEGKNIFHLPSSLAEYALQERMPLSSLLEKVDQLNAQLRVQRDKRLPPLTDDKIIVAWNGMLITALVEAGDVFQLDKYILAAAKAADALWKKQFANEKDLLRVNLDNKPSIPARQEDYAHFSEALLALYDVTADQKWLSRAEQITNEMIAKFLDKESGAFLMGNDEILFAQPRSNYDNATPSGNSVAIKLLARLYKRTGKQSYLNTAQGVLEAFSASIKQFPASHSYMLVQLDEILHGEISQRQFLARGAVKVESKVLAVAQHYALDVNITIRDGWHINAAKPLHEDLIATQISVVQKEWKLESVGYPEAKLKLLDFEDQPLALYQGNFAIKAKLSTNSIASDSFPLSVSVQIQACNEETCLPPETVTLSLTSPFEA